jgi:hypothetical protein
MRGVARPDEEPVARRSNMLTMGPSADLAAFWVANNRPRSKEPPIPSAPEDLSAGVQTRM